MTSTSDEIMKMMDINDQLVRFSEIKNEAKILKRITDFTSFLQKSYLDLKRLYKAEMSLKTEMKLDPGMNPIRINTKNLMLIIEKIDPKEICYYNDVYETPGVGNGNNNAVIYGYSNNNLLPNQRYGNNPRKLGGKQGPGASPFGRQLSKSKSNLEESSVNLTPNNPNNPVQYDNIAEDLKNVKNNLVMMDMSAIKTEDSESDIFNKRKNKLNIPKPEKYKNQPHAVNNMGPTMNRLGGFGGQRVGDGQFPSNQIIGNKGNLQGVQARLNRDMNNMSQNTPVNNSRKSSVNSKNRPNSQSNSKFSLPKLNQVDNPMNKAFGNIPKVGQPNFAPVRGGTTNKGIPKGFVPMFVAMSDSNFVLKLNLDYNEWTMERMDNISTFDGGLKNASLVCIKKDRLVITGGCYTYSNEPSNDAFEINSSSINHSIRLRPMTHRRWAHSTCFIEPNIYIIGGFDHKDVPKVEQSTLKFMERYNIDTMKYEGLAGMNQARAFSGVSVVNQQSIFVFGGFYNDTLVPSIEKYDIMANVWVTYHVKLIDSLAKMGVLNYKNNIILLGGINEEYQFSNRAIVLDLQIGKWKKLPEMISPRVFNNSAFIYDSSIYVIGGNSDSTCERFDFITNAWNSIGSYTSALKGKKQDINEVYSYCFSLNFEGEQNF